MNCTHPVLYDIGGALKCIICGATIAADSDETTKVNNPADVEQTAQKQPKNAVKRNTKKRGAENG